MWCVAPVLLQQRLRHSFMYVHVQVMERNLAKDGATWKICGKVLVDQPINQFINRFIH
jgi:hypothetical protein